MDTCTVTGHTLPHFHFGYDEAHMDCVWLKQRLKEELQRLIQRGVTTFLSGMALGAELWATELVLELKAQYPLRLIAVLPCETQADRWTEAQRERYFNILPQCDEVIYISRRHTATCMRQRNRYLIDHAAYLLAVYDGSGVGGTAYTVTYATSKEKTVIVIPAKEHRKLIDFPALRVFE